MSDSSPCTAPSPPDAHSQGFLQGCARHAADITETLLVPAWMHCSSQFPCWTQRVKEISVKGTDVVKSQPEL